MTGRTNTGGGSAFAVIDISYPEGAACTCSNGVRTMQAKDTSGHWMFQIPRAGEWTVTAAKGDKSRSQTVDVAEKRSYGVTLAYEWVLIDNGTLNTSVTGEWEIDEYDVWDSTATPPSMTNESDHLAIYTGVGRNIAISHSNAIDVTNCKTLSIKVSAYQTRGTAVKVGVSTSNTGSDLTVSSGNLTTDNKTRTITLDVSSVNGNVYFKAVSGEQMQIKIYDLRIV